MSTVVCHLCGADHPRESTTVKGRPSYGYLWHCPACTATPCACPPYRAAPISRAELVSLETIRRHYQRGEGARHWFDRDTMRFFRSRVAAFAYVGPAGIYFVSSERGPDNVRRYSVREYHAFARDIDTVGGFQAYASRASADRAARKAAEGVRG